MRISFRVLALLCFTEVTSASSIRVLNDCNEELDLRTVYTVLNGERNTLDGWNHVQKAKPDHEYSSLRLDDTAYDIRKARHKADQSCDGALVQDAILVLKLSVMESTCLTSNLLNSIKVRLTSVLLCLKMVH